MAAAARAIDLSARPAHPVLALVLALLSLPGTLLTWGTLPGGGFVFGLPFAVAAIALGLQARARGERGRGQALAAVLVGAAMVALIAVWTVVEAL
jgi:hypothetical protein